VAWSNACWKVWMSSFFCTHYFSFALHMNGAKESQHHFRAKKGGHTNQHQGGQV